MRKYIFKILFTGLLFSIYLFFSGCSYSDDSAGLTIASKNRAITIYVDDNIDPAVLWAVNTFVDDVNFITGRRLEIVTTDNNGFGEGIYISTVGKPLSNSYQNILPDSLYGKWEAYHITRKKESLYLTGSDIRGTIFSIFEISERLGISPWEWWADVKPLPAKNLKLNIPEKGIFASPDVQYRGIFINDEDWGLQPWAANTFEPEIGDIGPKTYEKVFQLLLRLKANTIWPAMHPCTKGFYQIKGNREMAAKYHIVVGTSHCEPMMRNNVAEWNHQKQGDYNFFTNSKTACDYWQERSDEVRNDDTFTTIGMRGVHDGHMNGAKNIDDNIKMVEHIMDVQRKMLAGTKHKPIDSIPQAIVIYKEVLNLYNAGLKVPDDVTLMWCDDNHGYITRLSDKEEQKRKGGSGVYYHLSYWGAPHDYLWLSTTQPSLIWEEMTKAYLNGARKIWIANVGDIKPTEYNIEFFLDLAWDVNSINQYSIHRHLLNWAAREFGEDIASDVVNIMNEYYRLAFIRRPEFMGWSMVKPRSAPVRPSEFTPQGQKRRIDMYAAIMQLCDKIKSSVPESRKDAWFQLVEYPVKSAGYMNQKFMYAQMASEAKTDEEQKRLSSLSEKAFNEIKILTYKYNNEISDGKWKNIMSMHPRNLPVFRLPHFINNDKSSTPSLISNETDDKADIKRLFLKGDENTNLLGKEGYKWSTIEGLGYSGNAITLMPLKMKTFKKKSPRIEYSFFVEKPCTFEVQIRFLPTYSNLFDQQVSVRVNRSETKYFDLNSKTKRAKWNDKNWRISKLRNSTIVKFKHTALKSGKQIVSIRVNQTGIIIDQLAVDFVMDKPFYEIPAE